MVDVFHDVIADFVTLVCSSHFFPFIYPDREVRKGTKHPFRACRSEAEQRRCKKGARVYGVKDGRIIEGIAERFWQTEITFPTATIEMESGESEWVYLEDVWYADEIDAFFTEGYESDRGGERSRDDEE